eukprot:2890856-Alexandrium_andersonii.AAC.1
MCIRDRPMPAYTTRVGLAARAPNRHWSKSTLGTPGSSETSTNSGRANSEAVSIPGLPGSGFSKANPTPDSRA